MNTERCLPYLRAAAISAPIVCLLFTATVAWGGTYTVGSCQAAPADRYRARAFDDFENRGMVVTRACDPDGGNGLRGLIVRNGHKFNRVPRGALALVTMTAPPGTQFTTLRWAGALHRPNCAYTTEVYADGPHVSVPIIDPLPANQQCDKRDRVIGAATYKSIQRGISGATRIVQRVICVGTRRRPSCSTHLNNYAVTYKAAATIADASGPNVSIVADTPLAQGAWVSGSQPLNYDATDNAGVRAAHALLNGQPANADDARPCVLADTAGTFSATAPCPNGAGQIRTNTAQALSEGSQSLQVRAEDAGGNPGLSPPVTARIDNTAPPRVDVGVVRGEAWRNTNDFTLAWVNPYEGDRAPIAAARYTLCAAGATSCMMNEVGGLGISALPIAVPAPGQWTVSITRRDQAGNIDEHAASTPVTLRYDPEPPTLGFEPIAAADPTQIAVDVRDKVSGLAGGIIEISRQGSNTWQTLATQQDAGRLVARIDDASLPAGTYVFRARAEDHAGNEASTDRRLDGQAMVVNLPLRVATTMQAGVARTKTTRQRIGRRGHRRWVLRRTTVLVPTARSHARGSLRIVGRLTTATGQAIPDAGVQVYAATPILGSVLIGTVQADATGTYHYSTTATSTATLRFAYPGSGVRLPAQAEIAVTVPGASSMTVRPRRVLNGQTVTFRGRLATLPVPAGGKLIELQAYVSGRWQTFTTTRSDQAGRFQAGYRFQRTRGTQRYRFRARIPAEAGYPFATGASGGVSVLVKGR